MSSATVARHLDVTGTFCPLPILLAAREMLRLAPGDWLEIVGDDPAILEDMPVWCERAGHRLVRLLERGGKIVSVVEKGGGQRRPVRRARRPGDGGAGRGGGSKRAGGGSRSGGSAGGGKPEQG